MQELTRRKRAFCYECLSVCVCVKARGARAGAQIVILVVRNSTARFKSVVYFITVAITIIAVAVAI